MTHNSARGVVITHDSAGGALHDHYDICHGPKGGGSGSSVIISGSSVIISG